MEAALRSEDDAHVYFGLLDGARVVGLVAIRREERRRLAHRAELTSMYVDTEARGTGWAGRLLDAALKHAANLDGVKRVSLTVAASNEAAVRLYVSRGFRTWGVEPASVARDDGTYAEELHMVRFFGEPSAR